MALSARFQRYRHAEALERIVRDVLPSFPELEDLRWELDLLPSSSWHYAVTESFRTPPRIRLRPARPANPSLTYTVPHELTHLLQRPLRRVPDGERSADVHAMARTGDAWRVPPGYLRFPRSLRSDWNSWAAPAAELAREALRRRSSGTRNYIAWWEEAFREAVTSGRAPGGRASR
jgi:hypothetical protein